MIYFYSTTHQQYLQPDIVVMTMSIFVTAAQECILYRVHAMPFIRYADGRVEIAKRLQLARLI